MKFIQSYTENSLNGKREIYSTVLNTAISSGKCLSFIKFMVENGADIDFFPHNNAAESPIAYAILTDNLKVAKYLIIDKQAVIPSYVFKRQANISYRGQPEKYLTITEILTEQNFEKGTENYELREENN